MNSIYPSLQIESCDVDPGDLKRPLGKLEQLNADVGTQQRECQPDTSGTRAHIYDTPTDRDEGIEHFLEVREHDGARRQGPAVDVEVVPAVIRLVRQILSSHA